MKDGDRIVTRGSEFWIEGGYLRGRTLFDAPHGTLEDAVAGIDAMMTLAGGRPAPLLFDARHVNRYDRRARAYMVEHADTVISAAAMLSSSGNSVIVNPSCRPKEKKN